MSRQDEDPPWAEMRRQLTVVQTGIFHLRLAIEAFGGLANSDLDDLRGFLDEALEVEDVLTGKLAAL